MAYSSKKVMNMDIDNVVQRLRAMNADGVGYVGHAADVIEALQADLRIEILQRERKISEADSFIAAVADTCEHAERVAAESQAREKSLLEVLAMLCDTSDAALREKYWLEAHKIINQPSDDAALKQMLAAEFNKGYERGCSGYHEGLKIALAAERERCEKACRQLEVHDAGHPGTAFKVQGMCIDAIRALGDRP